MTRAMRLGVFGGAIAAAALLVACDGEPDDPFFFYGKALDSDGTPLAGAPIQLLRATEPCGWVFHERAAGLRPDGGNPMELFEAAHSDIDGTFLFVVLRYEQTREYCFRGEISADTGAKTVVPVGFNGRDFEADRLILWTDGYVDVSPSADGHSLQSVDAPLPPSDPVEGSATDVVAYEWNVTVAGEALWREERKSALVLDSYLREDFGEASVRVDLLATLARSVDDLMPFGSTYREYASGPPTVIPALAPRVPSSRGAPCAFGSYPLDPCPLTDGDLDLVMLGIGDCFSTGPPPIEIALTVPARPTLLVVRDLQGYWDTLDVDGSADGGQWYSMAEVAQEPYEPITGYKSFNYALSFLRVPLSPPPEPVSRLRLSGVCATGAREISFFE